MSKIIQTSGREGSIILACSFFTRPLCASQRRKSSTLKLSNSGAPSNFRKTIAWLCQRNRLSFLTRRNHRRRHFSRPANGRLNGSFASHSKRFFFRRVLLPTTTSFYLICFSFVKGHLLRVDVQFDVCLHSRRRFVFCCSNPPLERRKQTFEHTNSHHYQSESFHEFPFFFICHRKW